MAVANNLLPLAPPAQKNTPDWSATSCSPTGYPAVPSALGGLTSGFGMGPGVPPLPWSLTNQRCSWGAASAVPSGPHSATRLHLPDGTAKNRMKGRARPISTARLRRSRALHLRPIASWSTRGLTERKTHLGTGFPLRCFQRLSRPDSATGQCRWSTTRTPEVRPPRSSRTRGSLPQFSYAHGG